jgi:anti-sigma28 factor (negative regulator of flagellin synthesis)
LQRKIDVGKQRGQLTPDEANRLQTYLSAVNERVAKYRRDGFLTGDEKTKVNEMLTTLEERVRAERTDDEVAQRDAVDKRVAELQRRIDAGARAGQLTRDEATQLQARLNRITEKEAQYRADGRLTNDETSSLNQMLNTMEERIRYERNDTDAVHREAFEKRIAEIKRIIEAGMRAGQITLEEAWRLQTILNRIRERDAQFRSDGVLTREERIRLNRMLTHLEEQVYEEKWDANVDNPVYR